jgi:hypothetical protein
MPVLAGGWQGTLLYFRAVPSRVTPLLAKIADLAA